ncbi:MAG: hypothetical protein CME21_06430 [Gemmatimonadetes bacterium]|nr:hypothetical protein [Gemmatimonadota bacterium]
MSANPIILLIGVAIIIVTLVGLLDSFDGFERIRAGRRAKGAWREPTSVGVGGLRRLLGRLVSRSPAWLLWRLLGVIDQKSRSAEYESITRFPQDPSARPIFLLGFARTGTTTTQRVLSDCFSYNASFEPIGFNHAQYEPEAFSSISARFRGQPDAESLSMYSHGGGTFFALHTLGDSELRDESVSQLGAYLDHLFQTYGRNVITKEVRLSGNAPTLAKVCRDLSSEPVFVLSISDPLVPAYTFYRAGGLIDGKDTMGVDDQYAYRRRTLESIDKEHSMVRLPCRNRLEKLIVSILIEQAFLRDFAMQNKDISFLLDFEHLGEAIQEISRKFGLPVAGEPSVFPRNLKRYRQDAFFLRMVKDLHPDLMAILAEQYGWDGAPDVRPSLRSTITRARLGLLPSV